MDEVHKCQTSLCEALSKENEKYQTLEDSHNISDIIQQAKVYHEKLINLKKNMLVSSQRVSKLKKKVTKLLEDKNKEEVEKQKNRQRREMLERHLEPVFKPSPEESTTNSAP